jgi:D-alanine-D-alanine ligase
VRLKVALLFGGRSGEHEVSLRSGASVAAGLRRDHSVQPVLIDHQGRWFLQAGEEPTSGGGAPVFLSPSPDDLGRLRRLSDGAVVASPDVFFPVLHGPFGEDGTIQGLLELAGVAYVGSGVAASAAAMDKELMKGLFAASGLPQVSYRVLRAHDLESGGADRAIEELGLPAFVKPASLGSSVGVSKVKRHADLKTALDTAFLYDRKVVVERAVEARELEVSVMGNDSADASLPGEIVPDREFYDYDSKYSENSRTQLLIPAPVSPQVADESRALAVRAFRSLDACGYARVDFFLEKQNGRLLINEINTIPGFTSISMFPKLWEASGLSYADLLARLVELGLERHREKARLSTSYRP